ncbi:hypothetical protein FB561_2128 [Kribbella amoyensis]|uniref:Uncharacterized protein n=1 Tax=Kribbella amoyensis TaxID=996641 RepID=A0A561BQ62_9ACTN|nr:type IV toxin-antitoxin system AbiEi family antitoxin domain-containing protein [Kribbella amoyensis]TWD81025.1 hypothetical protein FB561_2128 [Kribbella amoyensis]
MNRKLSRVAAGQGGVFSRRQALACGYTVQAMQARLADGRWERIRYGQYAESLDLSHLPRWERERVRHERLVHAAVNSMRPGSVAVSHQSAAVIHGAPTWGLELEEAHLTRLEDLRSGRLAQVRHHRGTLTPADLTEIRGLRSVTVARALVETACTTSFEVAVVLADALCRLRSPDEDEFDRLARMFEFWPGSTTARAALAFRDPQAESVGESRLRVLMHNEGLPAPLLQMPIRDAAGLIGRVDFFFPGDHTVVEFDGLLKYADGSADVLVREKNREDRLRGLGLEVVRVTWPELGRPEQVAIRIRQAFTRARRSA